jgi:hypothetical protein
VLLGVVPGSVVAQRHAGPIAKPRHPRSAELNSTTMAGHLAALRTTLDAPPALPFPNVRERVPGFVAGDECSRVVGRDARAEGETGG